MIRSRGAIFSVCFALLAMACQRQPSTILEQAPAQLLAQLQSAGHSVDAGLAGGRVRYLGFESYPSEVAPGDTLSVVHYWYARTPLDRSYRVFVHFQIQGAMGWVPHGDHEPIPPTDQWPAGRVIRDEHRVRLPDTVPGRQLDLWVGLYQEEGRLPVDQAAQHDGTNRIRAGAISVHGTPVMIPSYRAPKLSAPPQLDGEIHDAEWGGAAWTVPFTRTPLDAPARLRTRARLAWDEQYLYVAFSADDPDLQGTMTERDDPVYREEALEVFLDAAGDGREYIELQASPRSTQFDARFRGGPRQNADVGFNATWSVATHLDGTLNDPSDVDQAWSAEWRIQTASLGPGFRAGPGETWRINLFRVARDRARGQTVREESGWSPPLTGDFHNLRRFGRLSFGD